MDDWHLQGEISSLSLVNGLKLSSTCFLTADMFPFVYCVVGAACWAAAVLVGWLCLGVKSPAFCALSIFISYSIFYSFAFSTQIYVIDKYKVMPRSKTNYIKRIRTLITIDFFDNFCNNFPCQTREKKSCVSLTFFWFSLSFYHSSPIIFDKSVRPKSGCSSLRIGLRLLL